MERKRRDEDKHQESLVVEKGMIFNLSLVPLPLVSFLCGSFFKVLSAKKKFNNHFRNMHKGPTSCNLCLKTF